MENDKQIVCECVHWNCMQTFLSFWLVYSNERNWTIDIFCKSKCNHNHHYHHQKPSLYSYIFRVCVDRHHEKYHLNCFEISTCFWSIISLDLSIQLIYANVLLIEVLSEFLTNRRLFYIFWAQFSSVKPRHYCEPITIFN